MCAVRFYSRDLRVPWGIRTGRSMRNRKEIGAVWLTEDIEITDGNTNINEKLGSF